MSTWKTLAVACNIYTRSKHALKKIAALEKRFFADIVDPLGYQCRSCDVEWGCDALDDWSKVVCSNCYSERVDLVRARLTFHNWGEQNGGIKERDGRYAYAKREAKQVGAPIRGGRKV